MSQSINPTSGSFGEATPPSTTNRRGIVAGILVAAALGAAAIGLYNAQPWSDVQTSAPQAQTATVPSLTGGFEYGTEASAGVVSSEYLGGSRELSPQVIAQLRADDMVEHFASQWAAELSPQVIAQLRADDMVEHFASQSAAVVSSEYLGGSRELSPQVIAQLRGDDMVEYFASQWAAELSPQVIAELRGDDMVEYFASQSATASGAGNTDS